jgi:hypothetical protein
MGAKLQSAGPSLTPPLLQNRTCLSRNIRLLSIRGLVIGTAQTVTRKSRLANALLGQLAFTTSKDVCHKALAFLKYLSLPEYPPSVGISLALPRALACEGILPTGASGWLPTQSKAESHQWVTPFRVLMGL